MNLDFISIKMKYTICFEIFGRMLKHTVIADSLADAQSKVRLFVLSRLIFHGSEQAPKPFDFLTDVVNGKKYPR